MFPYAFRSINASKSKKPNKNEDLISKFILIEMQINLYEIEPKLLIK